MNGICLCIDRFHLGYVGAYGSTWGQTPALDQLAADGFVFDQFHVDSLETESLYRSCWFGRHALELDSAEPAASLSMPAMLRDCGVTTVLATDDPAIASLRGADDFVERFLLPEPRKIEPAPSVEAAHLARCFAQLVQKVESLEPPFFLWCHLASLGRIWDAPWEMRSQYAEADDPDPPVGAEVPCRPMAAEEDPDELLGIVQAYAGQVTLLDLCIGALGDALTEAGREKDTVMAVLGLRGLALGEHRYVGPNDERLDGELVHVPLIFRLPDPDTASARSPELVQTADLCPTWLRLLANRTLSPRLGAADLSPVIHDQKPQWRDRIGLVGPDGLRAVRTPAWYLTMGSTKRLFSKPDDLWEANDVADRHSDVADRLAEILNDYRAKLSDPQSRELVPLDDVLRHGIE